MLIKKITSFFGSNLINKSIRVLLLRIIGVILFFTLTLFITNNFNSNLVGKYDFTRSLLMFLGAFSILGMQQSIIYYSGYLKGKKSLDALKAVYLKMILISFLASSVILIFFLLLDKNSLKGFFNQDISKLILKSVFTLFFYSITMLNIEVFRAIYKIYLSEIFRNIFRYLPFLIGLIFIYYTNNSEFLVDLFLLNFIFLGILSTVVLLLYFKKNRSKNKNKRIIGHRDIIKRSVPMAISSIAFILMQSIDIILLSKFSSFNSVAYYGVAVKLTMIISLALTSVNAVFAPKIAELFSLNKHNLLNMEIRKATRLIFLLTTPCIVLLMLFSNFILNLFGAEYSIAQYSLFVLLIGQSVNAFCGSVGIYMNMTGKQNVLQLLLIGALIVNLVLNLGLIPKYGINGAAVATCISMILWNIIGTLYLYKKDKIKTFLS